MVALERVLMGNESMGKLVRPLCPGISISQKGFGAATGGTLGCFVQDCDTNRIMLLSNMHVIQFFQPSGGFLGFGKKEGSDALKNTIVQPCGIEIKNMAERTLGRDKLKVYNQGKGAEAKLLPSPTDLKEYYQTTVNGQIDTLSELCSVAEYSRGYLEADFDAAVAELVPGTLWTNKTPDGTQILAPPDDFALPIDGQVWKYGDASGAKKWGVLTANKKTMEVPFKTFQHDSNHFGAMASSGLFRSVPITFKDVLMVSGNSGGAFQIQGDSGSALCDDQNRLIGLMSTGGIGSTAYAISIDRVFDRLGVRFPDTISGVA